MSKLSQNEKGFSAIETVMALVIVILIGAVGYLVYKNHNASTVSDSKTKAATSASSKVSAAKVKKIKSYAECIADKKSKTDTDKYPPSCTTAENVTFLPSDPNNFSKVGERINIPNNPKVTTDTKVAESGGYCYNSEVPGPQATATLEKLSGNYAQVGLYPNCGDYFALTYQYTNGHWSEIYASHMGLCFYPESNPNVSNSAILQSAVSKLCD